MNAVSEQLIDRVKRKSGFKRGHIDPLLWVANRNIELEKLFEMQCGIEAEKVKVEFLNTVREAMEGGQISDEEGELFVEWAEEDWDEEKQRLIDYIKTTKREHYMSQNLANNHANDVEIGEKLVKRATENVAQQEELVNRVQDAKKALDLAVSTIRKDAVEFLKEMDGYLVQMRQTRFALDSETKQLLAAAGDVRQFFLSEKHLAEVTRLKEFVNLCAQLKALKESGFLDTVADTMLKLEGK